jgi:hypothetical protein
VILNAINVVVIDGWAVLCGFKGPGQFAPELDPLALAAAGFSSRRAIMTMAGRQA